MAHIFDDYANIYLCIDIIIYKTGVCIQCFVYAKYSREKSEHLNIFIVRRLEQYISLQLLHLYINTIFVMFIGIFGADILQITVESFQVTITFVIYFQEHKSKFNQIEGLSGFQYVTQMRVPLHISSKTYQYVIT